MEQKDFVLSATARAALAAGIEAMLLEVNGGSLDLHTEDTPRRVVKAYEELLSGVGKDAAMALNTHFDEHHYNQMITVANIEFVSMCSHHLLPFHGVAHFAYIPDGKVVGLSKIPRMIDILAHRPQVQERLTQQIVDTFQSVVGPLGCGVMLEAWHACMGIRGVRKPEAMMRTTALTGLFLTKPEVKEEFLLTALRGTPAK